MERFLGDSIEKEIGSALPALLLAFGYRHSDRKSHTVHDIYICIYIYIYIYACIPVVPHKAVAEVFKNRKPIGAVGCCESGMAERSR